MNKAIIIAVQDLESSLLNGVISERLFQKELDHLLEMANDEATKEYVRLHKDRDI